MNVALISAHIQPGPDFLVFEIKQFNLHITLYNEKNMYTSANLPDGNAFAACTGRYNSV